MSCRIEQKSKYFSSELQRLDSFYKNIHIVVIHIYIVDYMISKGNNSELFMLKLSPI